jgi:hypothetical protein
MKKQIVMIGLIVFIGGFTCKAPTYKFGNMKAFPASYGFLQLDNLNGSDSIAVVKE